MPKISELQVFLEAVRLKEKDADIDKLALSDAEGGMFLYMKSDDKFHIWVTSRDTGAIQRYISDRPFPDTASEVDAWMEGAVLDYVCWNSLEKFSEFLRK